jgi:hypothetical protein
VIACNRRELADESSGITDKIRVIIDYGEAGADDEDAIGGLQPDFILFSIFFTTQL